MKSLRSASKFRPALLAGAACLALLTGCAAQSGSLVQSATNLPPDKVPVGINQDQSMFPANTSSGSGHIVTLNQMKNLHSSGEHMSKKKRAEEMMFLPAMKQAALSYGVAGGLAWSTHLINGVLRQDSGSLSKSYDFSRIVTHTPNGALILPPVISSSKDTYQEADFGRTIRVASRTYDIIREASFAPNAPLWFNYLYRPWTAPKRPPDAVLPRTDAEQQEWNQYVAEGWADGVQQGEDMFRLDLHRLNRDFVGMIRYRRLYDAGKVSAPVVQHMDLGVTGNGQTMRENDQVDKIVQEPSLAVPEPVVHHKKKR